MDPPAAPSSLHPMINDLNLKVQDPSNNTVYPNSRDDFESVNNVEVIHGDNPIPATNFVSMLQSWRDLGKLCSKTSHEIAKVRADRCLFFWQLTFWHFLYNVH